MIRDPTPEQAVAEIIAAYKIKRANPDAPDGYTPTTVECPSARPTIREASSLSDNETAWLPIRRNQTVSAMKTLLAGMNITGLDTDTYISNAASNNVSNLPNIGIAVSGGGYRAMLNGAGAIAAFDNRTTHNSTAAASLSGLLQSATYLAGLSGGSWLVGSLYTNNFSSIENIISSDTSADDSGSLWQLGNSILEGPSTSGIQLLGTADYYKTLVDEVDDKGDAGYNTTLTDYWGRALSFQLVNASDGGPGYTFSSIQDDTWFTSGNAPMPILITDSRAPGEVLVEGNSTIYEINPWELGTFDPTTYAFAPLRYLGSNFSAGVIPENGLCVRGFDNAGFMMGTSSTLFNEFILELNTTGLSGVLYDAAEALLTKFGESENDIADYPNPFYHFNNATNNVTNTDQLTLTDGGEDGQNIPLVPLLQPFRNVDVIFAIDSSADTSSPGANWPNGTSLVASYERQFLPIANGTAFPYVPDQNTFVNLGLNTRPTFFGCDVNNLTGPSPLIVYLGNAPYSYSSNTSTFDLEYSDTERNDMINNGYDVVTMGNGTLDKQWPTCVGCAILSRSLNRTGTTVPDVCNTCFERYCWDGTLNTTFANYTPTMKLENLNNTSSAGTRLGSGGSSMALTAALAAAMVLAL